MLKPEQALLHGPTGSEWDKAHAQLRDNDPVWRSLGFAYLQHDPSGGLFEYRHCPCCLSTIARPISTTCAAELLADRQAQIDWSQLQLATAAATGNRQVSRRAKRAA